MEPPARFQGWQRTLVALCSAAALCGLPLNAQAQASGQTAAQIAAAQAVRVQEQLRQGRALDALATADAALSRQPGDAALRFLRGVALMDLRRDAQAAQVFTELAEAYPELPEPWNNLALLHVRAGRLQQALQALEVALRNDPSHRAARLNLGEVYLMLAAQSWEQAGQTAALEPAQAQRLQLVRQLLSTPTTAR